MGNNNEDELDEHSRNLAEHEKRITITEQAVDAINRANEANALKLDLILAQITKVAVLEERHKNQELDVNRAHNSVSSLRQDLNTLSTEAREFIAYSKGQSRVLWWLSGIVGGLFVKVFLFAASTGMH